MSGYQRPEKKEPLRPSQTSKYFKKTGVKKTKPASGTYGAYTKTDSQSRVCLYDKNHNFIKYLNQ